MRRLFWGAIVVVVTVCGSAFAEDANVKTGREAFLRGGQLVKDAQWSEALAAFEESARARPHPVTTFNIGACLRAMGQYTRAWRAFQRAMSENDAGGGKDLTPALAAEVKGDIDETRKLLATLDLMLSPAGARLAIDGRPLEANGEADGHPQFLAGTLPAGPGTDAPPAMRVILDPGTHVITVSRTGFADAIRRETIAPGATIAVKLELDRLPALLRISSNQTGAQVLVNDADVGLSPVEVTRPAGKYRVIVRKKGFLDFDTTATADPGQDVKVAAALREDRPALTQRWWFWTGAAAIVAGAALTTYFVTRPAPERPPLSGGGLGWTAKAP